MYSIVAPFLIVANVFMNDEKGLRNLACSENGLKPFETQGRLPMPRTCETSRD